MGGVALRGRASRDNIFIKQFVFHLAKFSILKFSLRNQDFLFLNFFQNSYFHFLQMSRNQIIIPLFMNHFHVTNSCHHFNHILPNQMLELHWPMRTQYLNFILGRGRALWSTCSAAKAIDESWSIRYRISWIWYWIIRISSIRIEVQLRINRTKLIMGSEEPKMASVRTSKRRQTPAVGWRDTGYYIWIRILDNFPVH